MTNRSAGAGRDGKLRELAQELVDRYMRPTPVAEKHCGCGWCGGLPHTANCLVGRMEAALAVPDPLASDTGQGEADSAEWWRGVAQKLGVQLHDARLSHECSEAVLSMTVDRLGGLVEGQPTHRGNFLQRIDALVAAESASAPLASSSAPQGEKTNETTKI